MEIKPVTLLGAHVRLEPLSDSHFEGLWQAARDLEVFRFYVEQIRSEKDLHTFMETAKKAAKSGQILPFATVDVRSGLAIGSTRYLNIDCTHRRVEIGYTWLGKNAQRTFANTESKYLLLRHAFEVYGCIRVEFKTDSLNEKSRAALLRIGAKEEGTLRNHFICDTGRYRHSVYYSITDSEWPSVKAMLAGKLASYT